MFIEETLLIYIQFNFFFHNVAIMKIVKNVHLKDIFSINLIL